MFLFRKTKGQGRFEKGMQMAGEAAREKTDLILLPENSVYGSFMEDRKLSGACADITRTSDGYLFLGVYGIHGYELRNSVFMVAPDGSVADVYHKQRLVPFFENGYEKAFDFEVGSERGIFETEYGKVGSMICFESLFTDVASDTVRKGAQLFVRVHQRLMVSGGYSFKPAFRAVRYARGGNGALPRAGGEHRRERDRYAAWSGRGKAACQYGGGPVWKGSVFAESTPYVWIGDWWMLAFLAAVEAIWLAGRKKRI